jgi:hypothetical protein
MRSEYRQLLLGEDFADLLGEAVPAAADETVDRDALCGKLIANMRAQLALYIAYRGQADVQRMALVNRRLNENQGVNLEVDKVLNSLAGLEAERIVLTASIIGTRAAGEASTPGSVKCEAIYPLVSAANAIDLRAVRGELLDAVAELKQLLAINQALVENGSKIIHTTIGILTSVVGRTKADKMNTYTAKGGVNVGKVQIRNLVNRSV